MTDTFKFPVGAWILRSRRKEPRQVLRYSHSFYVLSDSKNGFVEIHFNRYAVETGRIDD